jgi:polysaccharide biosynthesis protein PslH
VPDVRPFLARAGFLIVPLRIGGGSRLKILEALAAGTPVVSTRVGAEGLELASGRDLIVADTQEQLANAALAAIQRPEELTDTAESGRKHVLARYSWDLLAERLDGVWNDVARMPSLATAM